MLLRILTVRSDVPPCKNLSGKFLMIDGEVGIKQTNAHIDKCLYLGAN